MSRAAEIIRSNRAVIIIASLLVSAAIAILIISQLSAIRNNINFQRGIRRADVLISEGRPAEAEARLSSLFANADSPRDFLMLAARGRLLQSLGLDDSLFSRAVNLGFAGYPGNENLRALQVDGLIDRGELLEAARVAEGLESRQFRSLKVEAYLLGGRTLETEGLDGLLEGISVPLTPQAMADPFAMFEAGQLTGDYRYFVNGAVMLAALGRIDEAYEILIARRDELRGNADALILLRLAFDAGRYDGVDSISSLLPPDLGLQTSNLESLADLYFYGGEPERAYIIHSQAATRNPAGAGISLTNLMIFPEALAFRGGGNVAEIATEALEYHAGDPEISARAEIALSMHEDRPPLFAPYISRFPESFSLSFFDELSRYRSDQIRGGRRTDIIDLTDSLYDRINAMPDDDRARDLLLYLLAIQDDREGLGQVLARYRSGGEARLDLYRGYLDILYGRRESAAVNFQRAAESGLADGWYNLALINLEDRFPIRARDQLIRAEEILLRDSGGLALRSGNIHHRRLLDIWAHAALANLLADEPEEAALYIERIESAGSTHLLVPRIKEMFDN
jgi:tetratricopeptide (TPR) repeat protein